MTVSVNDGTTGQNFTTYLSGWTFSSFSIAPHLRRAMAVWYEQEQNYTALLSVFAYSPRSPPRLLSTCTLGSQSFWGWSAVLFVEKKLMVIAGNSIWSVTNYQSGNCVIVPIGPVLQTQYSPFCSLAFDSKLNSAYYINGASLVALSGLNTSNPLQNSFSVPEEAVGMWLNFGVDS